MPEPETVAIDLTCAECGRSPRAGETWRIVFADLGEAVTYCPDCAEREFGEPDLAESETRGSQPAAYGPRVASESDVAQAEHELQQLAAHLETVAAGEFSRAILALGHRARSLFLGFLHLLDGPAPVAAMSLLRPMIEVNLLIRFLARDPELHLELWIAEGQRQVVALLDDYEADSYLVSRWGTTRGSSRTTRAITRADPNRPREGVGPRGSQASARRARSFLR